MQQNMFGRRDRVLHDYKLDELMMDLFHPSMKILLDSTNFILSTSYFSLALRMI